MPLPLFWIGAGLTTVMLGHQMHKQSQRQRVGKFPGEDCTPVAAVNGSIVSCGIYGVFDHTGIWIDDNVVELKGNGLIRGISPQRFLKDRSGDTIYVACGGDLTPLVSPAAAKNAMEQLFHYTDYDVWNNNCHRFCWRCVSGRNDTVSRFSDLNKKLSEYFQQPIHWQPLANPHNNIG